MKLFALTAPSKRCNLDQITLALISILDKLCCKAQITVPLVNSRVSRLCVHPFDPLSAPYGSHEWIRKILCFPRNLVAPELHDAHGV